jgi:hypothetical protein
MVFAWLEESASFRVIGVEVQLIAADLHAAHQAIFQKVNPYKMLNGAPAERAAAECREFEMGYLNKWGSCERIVV